MKSINKRIFSVMFILIIAFFASSCSIERGEENSEDSSVVITEGQESNTDCNETEEPKPQYEVQLVSNGKSEYCIALPSDPDDVLIEAAQNLKEKIKTYTGADLIIEFGSNKEKKISMVISDPDSSDELVRNLRAKDWLFVVRKNEIVIGGGTSEAINSSIRHFLDKIIYVQGKKDSVARSVIAESSNDKEFRYNYYVPADYCVGDSPLKDFNIVYEEDSLYAFHNAALLRELIYERYGYYLLMYDDSYPEVENEILVGMTRRTNLEVGDFEFALSVHSGKLEVAFNRLHAKEAAYDYFSNNIFAKGAIDLEVGYELKQDISSSLKNGKEMVLENTGDVRLIISNIQASGDYTKKRMEMLSMFFNEYAPDAIALQEAGNKNVRVDTPNIFTMMKEFGYEEVHINNLKYTNYTPILYNTKTLEVLHSGFHLYSGANNSNSKSVTWAHFRTTDGKEFVFFSTHFMYTSADLTEEQGVAVRKSNATELSNLAKSLEALYGCPVIGGGDINCTVNSEPYNVLLDNGFENVRFSAQKSDDERGTCSVEAVLNEKYDTFIAVPNKSVIMDGEIDMMFAYGSGYTVKQHNVMADNFALYASDHVPVSIDISLS